MPKEAPTPEENDLLLFGDGPLLPPVQPRTSTDDFDRPDVFDPSKQPTDPLILGDRVRLLNEIAASEARSDNKIHDVRQQLELMLKTHQLDRSLEIERFNIGQLIPLKNEVSEAKQTATASKEIANAARALAYISIGIGIAAMIAAIGVGIAFLMVERHDNVPAASAVTTEPPRP